MQQRQHCAQDGSIDRDAPFTQAQNIASSAGINTRPSQIAADSQIERSVCDAINVGLDAALMRLGLDVDR